MKKFIEYTIHYPVFSNLLMIGLLLGGIFASAKLRRERFPSFSLDQVSITIAYPDALPSEVEEAICVKVEDALEGVDGIKKINSTARENIAQLNIELERGSDIQEVLNDIRNKVDSINTFPDGAEKPLISEVINKEQVINLALYGKGSEYILKEMARNIKDELLAIRGITQVSFSGVREYEIAIEVSEDALREYGLTISQVAEAVKRSSLNLPGGTLKTKSQEILLQTKERKYRGEEYREIIVLARPDGSTVKIKDVAKVLDSFEEEDIYGFFNREPAVMINVYRTEDEDTLEIAALVHEYCKQKNKELPEGLKIAVWSDGSTSLLERLDLVLRNGKMGFLLVLISLGFFLNLRLSFWVALGIPISFGGGLLILWLLGGTLNLISMFALIMALGIVVDDAIVIGENIYTKRQEGMSDFQAAKEGAYEMAIPVTAAILTSIIAFIPLLFIPGRLGKIISEIPKVMIVVLFASLLESLFVLPTHLRHAPKKKKTIFSFIRNFLDGITNFIIKKLYIPSFKLSLKVPLIMVALTISTSLFCVGLMQGGQIPFIFFPKLDYTSLTAQITFPQGTPAEVTKRAVRKIEAAAYEMNKIFTNEPVPLVQQVYAVVGQSSGFSGEKGSHNGSVKIELSSSQIRQTHSREVIKEWRKKVGYVPDVLSMTFGGGRGPAGQPIELTLLSKNSENLLAAASKVKSELENYEGVFEIVDDFRPGKLQILPKLKLEARLIGINEQLLGQQLFYGFGGQEVFRLQRGADEVKVKVRYPKKERFSFENLNDTRIRRALGNGEREEIPFTEVADLTITRGPAKITRQDGYRRVQVLADIDQTKTPAESIVQQMSKEFLPKLAQQFPGLQYTFEGQQQERRDIFSTLGIGFLFSMFCTFAILAVLFRSYIQPFIIMAIIPFGFIGAIMGHWALGVPMVIMSIFGAVALSGIVVNDSLVLINQINVCIERGLTVHEAVIEGGVSRFRPIILTTLTTIAGLFPITFEKSFQAQFVIPMAISIAGGLLFATFLTLYLIPALFLLLNSSRRIVYWLRTGKWPTPEEVEPAYRYREKPSPNATQMLHVEDLKTRGS